MTDALLSALRQSDPDRHAMALLAPAEARARLVTLYALNLELARAPLGARDPVLAQMRVQWWIDHLTALDHARPPAHALLQAVHEAWGRDAATLAPLAQARLRDAERDPFGSAEALEHYVDATAGTLMRLAAQAVRMPDAAYPVVDAQAMGAGLSAWLMAEPALAALGLGLQDPTLRRGLADRGMAAFRSAAIGRRAVPRALGAVLYPGAAAGRALRRVARGQGPEAPSDFVRRLGTARLAISGRWWVDH